MKKQIRETTSDKKTVQVTIADERWYVRDSTDPVTGLPSYQYVPSVTWIAGFYPKGIQFYQWLAKKGWDEAEAIKSAAGDKGSKVHSAIEALLNGQEVKMDSQFLNRSKGEMEELTVEEYECILSFADWWKTLPEQKTIISTEITVWSDAHGYAGTVDLVLEMEGVYWIVDIKTGQSVWSEYELQVSAYKHALKLDKEVKLGIIQVGYRKNKNRYKFTEI